MDRMTHKDMQELNDILLDLKSELQDFINNLLQDSYDSGYSDGVTETEEKNKET